MFRSLKTFVLACSSVGLIVGPAFDAQACGGRGGGGFGGGFGGGYGGAPRASCQPSYPQQQPYCPQCAQRPQFPQSGYEQLNQQSQYANSQYPGSQYPGSQFPGQFQGNQGQFDDQFQSPQLQNPQPQPQPQAQPFRSTQLQGLQANPIQGQSQVQVGAQSQGVSAQQFQGGQAQGQVVQGQQVQGQQVQGQQVQGQQVQGQQVQGQQVQVQGGQSQTAFRPRTTQVAARVGAPSASQSALSALGAAPVQSGAQQQQPVQQQQIQQPVQQQQQQTQQPIANPAPQQAPVDSQVSAPAEQPQQQPQSPEASGSYSAENEALQALLGTGVAQQPAAGQQEAVSAQTSGRFQASVPNGAKVQLNLNANGTFQWVATKDGKPTSFDGNYSIQNGSLTLQRTDNTKLEGTITFNASGFNLRFAAQKDQKDNGLQFVRG